MKVLVTGGTGFVGREILRQLESAGHTVRVLARRPLARQGVEMRSGSVLDPRALEGACDGVEGVIHITGIISEFGANTFENIHARGTTNVVKAASRAGAKRFVHMSALGTKPGAASQYHRSKWEGEEAVRASGLDWTIFRPSIIYGREDLFVNLFARMARFSPVLPVLGSGKAKLQPVPVEDVAKCFVGALDETHPPGQTYDLCGPDRLTLVEVIRTILEVTGRRRLLARIPTPLARLQASALETIYPNLLRKAPPLNRDQLIMLDEDNVGDPGPANEEFGLKPISFREGIARYLRRGP